MKQCQNPGSTPSFLTRPEGNTGSLEHLDCGDGGWQKTGAGKSRLQACSNQLAPEAVRDRLSRNQDCPSGKGTRRRQAGHCSCPIPRPPEHLDRRPLHEVIVADFCDREGHVLPGRPKAAA